MTPAAVESFEQILCHGPLSRSQIAAELGLSQAAVSKALAPLVEVGMVRTATRSGTPDAIRAPGRPLVPLVANPTWAHLVGFKVVPGAIVGVVTGMTGQVVASEHWRGDTSRAAQMLGQLPALMDRLGAQLPGGAGILGAGVSISGDVDSGAGQVRDSPRMGWHGASIAAELSRETGLPVVVDNDVRALAKAEQWFGVGRGTSSFALVTMGAGIGCGMLINGDVVAGAHDVAGELGHIPLGDPTARCNCGRYGCVEAVASWPAVVQRLRVACELPDLTEDGAHELARSRDARAEVVVAEAGRAMGAAIATLVNLVGPEVVLVTGEGATDYDLFRQHVTAEFRHLAYGAAIDCRIEVRPIQLTDWAAGAAVAALRALVRGGRDRRLP